MIDEYNIIIENNLEYIRKYRFFESDFNKLIKKGKMNDKYKSIIIERV